MDSRLVTSGLDAAHAGEQISRRQRTRAVVAATVGTTIEWYDFFLYGFAASLVLGRLYFPSKDALTSTLIAFATYFGGFVARPVGAILFGHYGDRVGRKATLVATLLLMGSATFLIGLVPTFAQIGILGGILLTVLRLLQGVGVGGEWGGSVLLAVEWGSRGRRGFMGSWPQFGVPAGLALSYFTLQLFIGVDPYWGWRIPFLLSAVLVAVGLYIRLGILETPVFARLLEERRIERVPVREVLVRQPRDVLLSCLIRTGEQAPGYIFTTFVLTYAVQALRLPAGQVLRFTLVAAGLGMVCMPLSGYLSDVVGRKRLYLIGATVMLAWAFPYWWLLDSRVTGLVLAAIAISLPVYCLMGGPLATLIAESFTGRLRYSGSSLGYQLASVTAGGPAPLIATWLLTVYHSSLPIAIYMAACAGISLVTAALVRDRSRQDMAVEYDRPPATVPSRSRALTAPRSG
jgi:MFS family permease